MAPRGGEAVEETLGGLNFNQPLSWRAGKPIQTSELLKRLGALSDELQEMDQEETDKDSLTSVAKELASHNLLSHKDKGVRASTAQCLVDVLKLCAPDAPFTGTQLKVWHTAKPGVHLANQNLGYIYALHSVHTSCSLRPFQCI